MPERITATTDGGEAVEVRTVDRAAEAPAVETFTVRVRQSAPSFFTEGVKVGPGDEVQMTLRQAQAASRYVDRVGDDGSLSSIPAEGQEITSEIPRAPVAGLARHERIESLQAEKAALEARLQAVNAQIEHEQGQQG